MRKLIMVTFAALLLAGCSSKTPASQPSVPATITPTASATKPAMLTRQQAGQKYLAITAPINAVFDKPECSAAEDYLVNGGSWDRSKYGGKHADQVLRACYKQLIPLYTAEIKTMQTTPWPADAAKDVADLVSLDQGFLHWLTQAVKGSTAGEMYTALQTVPPDDGSADRVRARFGLPGRSN